VTTKVSEPIPDATAVSPSTCTRSMLNSMATTRVADEEGNQNF